MNKHLRFGFLICTDASKSNNTVVLPTPGSPMIIILVAHGIPPS